MENSRYVKFEGVRITGKNFSGLEKRAMRNGKMAIVNSEGSRNFLMVFDNKSLAADLKNAGWNVKYFNDSNEPYIPVTVSYKLYAPEINVIKDGTKTPYAEADLEKLDMYDIRYADILINPSHWTSDDGGSGIKAYLKYANIIIEDDPFADKDYGLSETPVMNEEDIPF